MEKAHLPHLAIRAFLALLLLSSLSLAFGDFNTTATQVLFFRGNNTDTQDKAQAAIEVNLSAYGALFNSGCTNFQITLNSNGVEIPTFFNISGSPNRTLANWTPCTATGVYLRFGYNQSIGRNNEVVAVGYITAGAVVNPSFYMWFDHLTDNSSRWTCSSPTDARIQMELGRYWVDGGGDSLCYFNLTANIGTMVVSQSAAGDPATHLRGRSNVSSGDGLNVPPIYSDAVNPANGLAVNDVLLNTTGIGFNLYGGGWAWYMNGCQYAVYTTYNDTTPAMTLYNCSNSNPEKTIFGLEGNAVLATTDELAFSYAPSAPNYRIKGYNNSNTVWIENGTLSGESFSVSVSSPLNTTYLNDTPTLTFIASGGANTYQCWRTLDGTETSLGTVNNNSPFSQVLPSLNIGGHTVNITCQNSTTNISSSITFAEILYSINSETYSASVYETAPTHISISITPNSLVSSILGNLTFNGSASNATKISNWVFYKIAIVPLTLTNNSNVSHSWHLVFTFANGSTASDDTTSVNQSVLFAYGVVNFMFLPTTAFSQQTVGTNTTTSRIVVYANLTVKVLFNGSNTTATEILTNIFNASVKMPLVYGTNSSYGIDSTLEVSFNGITRYMLSQHYGINVWNFTLTNCSTSSGGTVQTLNFTLKNEINFSAINGTMEMTLEVWNPSRTAGKNVSQGFYDTTSAAICIVPSWATLRVDSFIIYKSSANQSGNNYPQRGYFLDDASIDNTTNFINLLLLNDTFARLTRFTLTDVSGQGVSEAIIQIQRYYPNNNTYLISAMVLTDAAGTGNTYLASNDIWYNFIVVKDGKILRIFPKQQITCPSSLEPCTVALSLAQENLDEHWLYYGKIAARCALNNATSILSCTVVDTSGLPTTLNLTVNEIGVLASSTICSTTASSGGATLWCNLGTLAGRKFSYTLVATFEQTSAQLESGIYDFGPGSIFGIEGIVIAFLLIITITLSGLWNPGIALGLAALGILISWMLHLITIGMGSIIGMCLVIAILIYKSRS